MAKQVMSPSEPAMLQRRRKGNTPAEDGTEAAAPASTTTATTPQKVEDPTQNDRFDPAQMALITQEMVPVPAGKDKSMKGPAGSSNEEVLALQDAQRPNGGEVQQMEKEEAKEEGPRGLPMAIGPPGFTGSPEPLFTPEQARQLEESQRQTPFIYQDRWASTPDGATWMSMATPPMMEASHHPHLDRRVQQVEEERLFFQWKMEKEKMAMAEAMRRVNEENMRLKLQLLEEKEKFATPEEATPEEMRGKGQVLRRLKNKAAALTKEDGQERQQASRSKEVGQGCRQASRSKEDGQECQQGQKLKEDGPECQQVQRSKEDGPGGRQVSGSKEDGQGCRQDLQEDGRGC